MFDNINWNKILNCMIPHINKKWKYLIIKADLSQTSYSVDFHYSINGNQFIRSYDAFDKNVVREIFDRITSEFKNITDKFNGTKEKMFLTIKASNSGNVKVLYSYIKEGNKLPWDESRKYFKLSEEDKTNW